jgi:hypothetical protein
MAAVDAEQARRLADLGLDLGPGDLERTRPHDGDAILGDAEAGEVLAEPGFVALAGQVDVQLLLAEDVDREGALARAQAQRQQQEEAAVMRSRPPIR